MMTNEEIAAADGREVGLAAAAWTIDGNTVAATVARVLQMFDDGDPAIDGVFRCPDLSGEWAGDSITEISDRGGWAPTTDACDAWLEACDDAFWGRVEELYSTRGAEVTA